MKLERMCVSTLVPLAVLVLACAATKEQPAQAANEKDSAQSAATADKRSWGHLDDKKSWGNFDNEKKSWGNFGGDDKRSWGSMEMDKKDVGAAAGPEEGLDKKSWGNMDTDKRGRYGSRTSNFFKKKSWGNPEWKRGYGESRYGSQGMYGNSRFFKRSVDAEAAEGAVHDRERRSVDDSDNNKRSWSTVNWEWLPKRRPSNKMNFFKRFDDSEDGEEKRGYGGNRNRMNFFKRARFFKRGWGNFGSDVRGWPDSDNWDEKKRSWGSDADRSEDAYGAKRSWGQFDYPQRRSWGNLDWPQVKKWGTTYKNLLEQWRE